MTRSARRSLKKLLEIEGGYSNHPRDPGGETNFGVSEELADDYGYSSPKSLDEDAATEILHEEFWLKNNLDEVARLNGEVAYEIFEFSVHAGSSAAVKSFQRALNAFNSGGDLYEDLEVDGILGELTAGAWEKYHALRRRTGNEVMKKAINGIQVSFLIRLAEENESLEEFVFGWINKRIKF